MTLQWRWSSSYRPTRDKLFVFNILTDYYNVQIFKCSFHLFYFIFQVLKMSVNLNNECMKMLNFFLNKSRKLSTSWITDSLSALTFYSKWAFLFFATKWQKDLLSMFAERRVWVHFTWFHPNLPASDRVNIIKSRVMNDKVKRLLKPFHS